MSYQQNITKRQAIKYLPYIKYCSIPVWAFLHPVTDVLNEINKHTTTGRFNNNYCESSHSAITNIQINSKSA